MGLINRLNILTEETASLKPLFADLANECRMYLVSENYELPDEYDEQFLADYLIDDWFQEFNFPDFLGEWAPTDSAIFDLYAQYKEFQDWNATFLEDAAGDITDITEYSLAHTLFRNATFALMDWAVKELPKLALNWIDDWNKTDKEFEE